MGLSYKINFVLKMINSAVLKLGIAIRLNTRSRSEFFMLFTRPGRISIEIREYLAYWELHATNEYLLD
jgi:hypothetical protein